MDGLDSLVFREAFAGSSVVLHGQIQENGEWCMTGIKVQLVPIKVNSWTTDQYVVGLNPKTIKKPLLGF